MSVYSDPEIISVLSKRFVPVVQDDWYARRADDAAGEFFRAVADQGPRKGDGGSTRQGSYAFTASGKLLAYNNNRGVERRSAMIAEALANWEALPEGERAPGALAVAPLRAEEIDHRFRRALPEGGVVLRTFTRTLDRGEDGELRPCEPPEDGRRRGFLSAFDHLWIQESEWRELSAVGRMATEAPAPLPRRLARRILRFHLVDNTRGEPPMWRNSDVRRSEITVRNITPKPADGGPVRLQVRGEVLLATASDPAGAERGLEARISGFIEVDPGSGAIRRFDMVALGDHWGEGRFTRGARPGRTPLGVAFELADGSAPGDTVPPQAIRWEDGYWEAERH